MPAPKTKDSRFARLETDPRFRRPKQKQLKVEIDDRFKEIMQGEEFSSQGATKSSKRIDKYGRPLAKSHHADRLKQFYRLPSPESNEQAQGSDQPGFVDYARGEGSLESSGSEAEEDDENSDLEEEVEMGYHEKRAIPGRAEAYTSDEDEDPDQLHVNLTEGSDQEEEVATKPSLQNYFTDDILNEEDPGEPIDPTKRFAIVNMDWDNMRAIDLYTVFSSILAFAQSSSTKRKDMGSDNPPTGRLLTVRVYPSEFGKERMAKEEIEGPAAEVFHARPVPSTGSYPREITLAPELFRLESQGGSDKSANVEEDGEHTVSSVGDLEAGEDSSSCENLDHEDSVSEAISDLEENNGLDMDKLRTYQLERLRYYYAVATFSDVSAASYVFQEVGGTEFERTANIFDLSYVPDDMDFEEDFRDEATEEVKGYKGNDFVTDALRHSNVKLTWDQDDPNRTKVLRRALTRQEIEEDDFKAYLASSSEEEGLESGAEEQNRVLDKARKVKNKGNAAKLRDMLLSVNEEDDVWGKTSRALNGSSESVADNVEITFKAGLSGRTTNSVDDEDLTTLERYKRRMKEKKDRKKEKRDLKVGSKAANTNEDDRNVGIITDDFFGASDGEGDSSAAIDLVQTKPTKALRPLDVQPGKPLEQSDAPASIDDAKHFSMADIVKAEKNELKKKRKRSRKDKSAQEAELGDETFQVDVKDDRFRVLYEEPEFAIDPSNPRFVKTKSMSDLLQEGTRRRAKKSDKTTSPSVVSLRDQSVRDLVSSVKRSAATGPTQNETQPKRKRRRH